MKKCNFVHGTFLGSFLTSFPEFRSKHGEILPEIAIAGRSNVGKSSLINHLLNHKNLARVSSLPGKTQTINFFNVDDKLILADLPGYGFAKRSKTLQEEWATGIDLYLKNRPCLKLLLLLIDSRRLPAEEELTLILWAEHYQKPILIIFTKSDTLTPHEREKQAQLALKELKQHSALHYSIKDSISKKNLASNINKRIYGTN
ncbi:MAG: ribosome biogenesis GTP-binding protein YihA/YsxC [Rhabdochlamydiaceae bacterium]|jgi:GTP-binding protein